MNESTIDVTFCSLFPSDRENSGMASAFSAGVTWASERMKTAVVRICEGMATGRSEIKTVGLPRFIGDWAVTSEDAAYLAWDIRRREIDDLLRLGED